MPVVGLVGPRQSGKTTLAKPTFPGLPYVSLERPDERAFAHSDPLAFLSRHPDGMLIDEVQRAPDLLSYIQTEVDADDRPGRFVLTGSQNIVLMERVSQTLAGRIAILTLLPFSLSELRGTAHLNPETLHDVATSHKPEGNLWETLWTGFYPRIHDRGLDPRRWLSDYHRTYVERDVREVLNVMDLDGFERFVRLRPQGQGRS